MSVIFIGVAMLVVVVVLMMRSSALPPDDAGGVLAGSSGSRAVLSSGGLRVHPPRRMVTATQTQSYDTLLRYGVAGRGILLQVGPAASRLSTAASGQLRLEQRPMLVDIEVPGSPPYQVQTAPLIPLNLVENILPGATVELRVDPGDPTQLMIYGPGVALPLAPYSGGAAPSPAAASSAAPPPPAAPAPVARAAPVPNAAGLVPCPSCGSLVSPEAVRKHWRKCTTCGASWD